MIFLKQTPDPPQVSDGVNEGIRHVSHRAQRILLFSVNQPLVFPALRSGPKVPQVFSVDFFGLIASVLRLCVRSSRV